MNLKHTLAFTAALAAAVSFAQDEDDVEESTETASEETAAKPSVGGAQEDQKWFFTLPVCSRIQGVAQVLKPGATEWATAEEGRFYPLGSSFRAAADGEIVITFGKGSFVTVRNGASFATRAQTLSVKSRTVVLTGGEVSVNLPGNLKSGLFVVTAPSFTVKNLAGESKYVYTDVGDGCDATVRCVTGSLEVEGRHFGIPAMHAADEFRIRASHDDLETVLYGKSGDYVIRLDRGLVTRSEIQDDSTVKDIVSAETLDFHLSVGTRVQINRAVPSVGSRMSVTMMTFDSAGTMQNNFAYAEGRSEVNTGELVHKAESGDDVAKRQAEATTEEAADTEDEAAEEPAEAEDSSSSETSSDDDDDF